MSDGHREGAAPHHEHASLPSACVFLRHHSWPRRSRQLLADRRSRLAITWMGRRDDHADRRIRAGFAAARVYSKWIWARPLALAEFQHPIHCCFIGLLPVSTLLIALAVAPYSHGAGQALFTTGAAGQLIFQMIFGIHRSAIHFKDERGV